MDRHVAHGTGSGEVERLTWEHPVDFCIIGVQKAGTSALFHFLAQHPSIGVSRKKEVHFFDSDDKFARGLPDYGSYHRLFPSRQGRIHLLGEATPIYIFWPEAIARIARYNPAMRLIAIFRDPVERAFAHWRMARARGYETLRFSDAIRGGRNRLKQIAPSALAHRQWSYVERGFYGAQVQRLLMHFPRDQVLFLRSDVLRHYHRDVLESVFAFLNVDRSAGIRQELVFPSASPSSRGKLTDDDVELLTETYACDLHQFSTLTGLDASDWMSPWAGQTRLVPSSR